MLKPFASLSTAEITLRLGRFLFFIVLILQFERALIGIYGYATALFALLFTFGDMGVGIEVTKRIAQQKRFHLHHLRLIQTRTYFTLLFFTILLLYLTLLYPEYALFLLGIALLFSADLLFTNHYAIERGYERFNTEIRSKYLIGFFYILSAGVGLLLSTSNPLSFIAPVVLLYLSYALFTTRYLFTGIKYFTIYRLKSVWKRTSFQFLGALFTLLYLRIDIIMLEAMTDLTLTGNYTIAIRFFELALIFPTVLSTLLLPKLIRHNTRSLLLFHLFLGVVLSVLFLTINTSMHHLLSYDTLYTALTILLLGIPFLTLNSYFFTRFIAEKKAKHYMQITLFMCLGNLLLNSLAIPEWGIEGAAIATLATEFLGTLLSYRIYRMKSSS